MRCVVHICPYRRTAARELQEINRMNALVELADKQGQAKILNWIDEPNGKRDGLSGREDRPFSHWR